MWMIYYFASIVRVIKKGRIRLKNIMREKNTQVPLSRNFHKKFMQGIVIDQKKRLCVRFFVKKIVREKKPF